MHRSRLIWRLIAALMAAGVSGAGWACGACIEDKVAATYDHAVVRRAIAAGQQVVFVAIDGSERADAFDRKIAGARVAGVVAGTVRTSRAPPAFSFALDAKETPARAIAGFRKVVGDPRAQLTLVRIVRDGRMIDPP
jgi:hypothetical protein